MNQVLKITTGILIALISFIFLVWNFMTYPEEPFWESLIKNILGFFGVSIGLILAGLKHYSARNEGEPFSQEKEKAIPKEEKKIEEIKKSGLKDFEKDDHERFMPK